MGAQECGRKAEVLVLAVGVWGPCFSHLLFPFNSFHVP